MVEENPADEEIINVSKEMNEENLKEMADKALMANLTTVGSTSDSEVKVIEKEVIKVQIVRLKNLVQSVLSHVMNV